MNFAREVRQLMAYQDKSAHGDKNALDEQKRILGEIAAARGAGTPGLPVTTENTRAMLAMVLSGGRPELAEAYANSPELSPRDAVLLEGAAAFMRGDKKKASSLLDVIHIATVAPSLRGRLALVKAMLLPDDDARKEGLLDFAINAMPGSLVEESALRRAALHALGTGREERFWRLANRYMRRFQESLFAPDFLRQLGNLIVVQQVPGKPVDPRLDLLLAYLPQERRLSMYTLLSRAALHSQRLDFALHAARRADRLEERIVGVHGRGELYVKALSPAPGRTGMRDAMAGINVSLLSAEDRRLMGAARLVADEIAAANASQPAPDEHASAAVAGLASRAELLMRDADRLLTRTATP